MSLWMRDMRREDISMRNGRVDGPFAGKASIFVGIYRVIWRTAAACL